MSQNTPNTESAELAEHEETWRQIDDVLDQLSRQSRSGVSHAAFFTEVLDNSVRTLGAVGGAVWFSRQEGLQLEYQINLAASGLVAEPGGDPEIDERVRQHLRLMEQVLSGTEPRAFLPHAGSLTDVAGQAASEVNPTGFLVCCAPIVVNRESRGLVEIFQRPDVSPATCQGFLQFLESVSGSAGDYLRDSDYRRLQTEAEQWHQLEEFSTRIYTGLDIREVTQAIAGEARPLIGCDRVTVAVRRGNRFRIVAVSGVDSIDRRADTIRAGEILIQKVTAVGEPVWYLDADAESNDCHPAQIQGPLNRYLDESPARVLGVLPLECDGGEGVCGALIVEQFEATEVPDLRPRAGVVARHSALAVANSLQHSNLPLLGVLKVISRMAWYLRLRQLPRTGVGLGLMAGIGIALATVPADFVIEGRGELQPLSQRGIFASTDGVVSSLAEKVRDSQGEPVAVRQREMLLELKSSSLDFEMTRVQGELRTARQSLNTVEIQRRTTDDPAREEELAAQATELAVTIESLQAQEEVLVKWKRELTLTSPIDGHVLTFDPVAILENRPVRQGEKLLEVADLNGQWVVEVRVADQNIGYFYDARKQDPNPDVTFVIATNPEKTWTGTVLAADHVATSSGDEGPTVLVRVLIEQNAIPAELLRPGATVIPHIHCGTRAVGFVWFHELIDVIRTKLLF